MYASPTIKVTSQPATEPITLEELKTRLRITVCDFDNELTDLMKSARITVENESYRKLITQTVEIHYEDFPGTFGDIEMRLAPISSITHVKYYDQDDTLTTVSSADYYTNLTSTPPSIVLLSGKSWPLTSLRKPNKVIVTATAGYGAASAVPPAAKLAIVEYCRAMRQGCEHATARYKALVSEIQWTAYHSVCT